MGYRQQPLLLDQFVFYIVFPTLEEILLDLFSK
jgi:hypothetical protein